MAKMKLSLCVFFGVCVFSVVVFGSGSTASELGQLESSNSSPNPNMNLNEEAKCSFKCEDFKALENDNRELKKSHAEILKKFELLSQKFDEFKNEISSDCGLSLLKPPLRGPPGKDGKDGKQGEKGPIDPRSLKSCSDAMAIFPSPRSTKQSVHPHGNTTKVEVLCDFETDGGGWTVIQKRSSGPKHEFNRTWTEYANGFGSLDGNFWLGLDNIRALTQNRDQELRIELEDFQGEKKYAKYSSFSVSNNGLSIAGFSGTAGDSMANSSSGRDYLSGMGFSTKDSDNDKHSLGSCSVEFGGGGWWYNNCAISGLNGLYYERWETVQTGSGVRWDTFIGSSKSLAKSEMKIRKRK